MERFSIETLGARGDGVARTDGGPVYIEGALPGEVVQAQLSGNRGRIVCVETPSPDRITPFCAYFDRCGGCVAQHMAEPLYRAWKTASLGTELTRAGITTAPAPMLDAGGEGRRRVVLHGRRTAGAVQVGFMAPRSHDLVAIDACPVLVPPLATAGPAAALTLARQLARFDKPMDIHLTATSAGLDVDIRGVGLKTLGRAADAVRLSLSETAATLDLARLSFHGDVVVERRPPQIAMGRALVVPPPGSFLQATAAGEAMLADLVAAGALPAGCAGKGARIADCFCGCGPFALRLAEQADVHAIELDEPALGALDRARRGLSGLRQITLEKRDLFRRPLLPPEIDRFDALVFDPPRAGAEALARQIAASRIGRVVAVSCDAGTFARDAAILVDGGFTVERIVPVDQFRYSPHIEIVGVFARKKAKS